MIRRHGRREAVSDSVVRKASLLSLRHRAARCRHATSGSLSALVAAALVSLPVASGQTSAEAFSSAYVACGAPDNLTDSSDASFLWLEYHDGQPYLLLPDVDNWARYGAVETVWSKLKLASPPVVGDAIVTLDLHDWTFSVSTGSQPGMGAILTQTEWGSAGDCRGENFGSSMRLNLRGTPFRYEAALIDAVGYLGHGSVLCMEEGQYCNATCGGYCGFCGLGPPGQTTTATLEVVDRCLFDLAVEAWTTSTTTTTTTTETSSTSSTSILGNTTTSTVSTITISSTTTGSNTSTSTSSTSRTSVTSTSYTTTGTNTSTTSATLTSTTTTFVDGFYFYRFVPTRIAEEGSTSACCCAHAISELQLRNCGADVDLTQIVAISGLSVSASTRPEMAIDKDTSTSWVDDIRQPLVLQFPVLTLVDEYSWVTATDCAERDPVRFEFHGSQDGVSWVVLDNQTLAERPPRDSFRPARSDWFNFKNCTETTTLSSTSISQTSRTVTTTVTTTSTRTRTTTTSATSTSSTTTTSTGVGKYVRILRSGTCARDGLHPIRGPAECESAARSLGLSDTSVEESGNQNRPEGCYLFLGGELWLGVNPLSKGKGAETSGPSTNETRHPICSSVDFGMRVATSAAKSGGALVQKVLSLALVVLLQLHGS